MYSPFDYTSVIERETTEIKGENNDLNIRESLIVSTEFPSELNTQRILGLSKD
jgi:hypothetical protein